MNNFKAFWVIIIVFCLLWPPIILADNQDHIVARGDGFSMGTDFVKGIEDHYAKQGHHAKWEFIVDAALRVKLFAMEELSLNQDSKLPDAKENNAEHIAHMVKLSEDYIFRLIAQFPVEDKTVLSYYRSYPEKFLKNGSSGRSPFQLSRIDEPLDSERIAPLDERLAGLIRLRIAAGNRQKIVSDELEKLMNKYQVEIVR